MASEGTRDRLNAVVSLEPRPTMTSSSTSTSGRKKKNKIERSDMNWVGRFGAMVPLNLQFDRSDCGSGCRGHQGTFTNAQWFLEYRPYTETTIFQSFNPASSTRSATTQGGRPDQLTRSDFHRESPTVLLITPAARALPSSTTTPPGTPVINTNISLNDPTKFQWNGGRLNMQDEKRWARTEGGYCFNFTHGDKSFHGRPVRPMTTSCAASPSLNGDAYWENLACRRNPNVFRRRPTPPTARARAATAPARPARWRPPGYGIGSTAPARRPCSSRVR